MWEGSRDSRAVSSVDQQLVGSSWSSARDPSSSLARWGRKFTENSGGETKPPIDLGVMLAYLFWLHAEAEWQRSSSRVWEKGRFHGPDSQHCHTRCHFVNWGKVAGGGTTVGCTCAKPGEKSLLAHTLHWSHQENRFHPNWFRNADQASSRYWQEELYWWGNGKGHLPTTQKVKPATELQVLLICSILLRGEVAEWQSAGSQVRWISAAWISWPTSYFY